MKEINLTQGYVAIVDDEDYERVSAHKWYATVERYKDGGVRCVYATANSTQGGKKKKILMHRYILSATDGLHVDHVNGNGLNNRRSNIRLCTNRQNQANRKKNRAGTSVFKGVSWNKLDKKWRAQIRVNGAKMHLGNFELEIDAAFAYDSAAIYFFGEFANTNGYGGL